MLSQERWTRPCAKNSDILVDICNKDTNISKDSKKDAAISHDLQQRNQDQLRLASVIQEIDKICNIDQEIFVKICNKSTIKTYSKYSEILVKICNKNTELSQDLQLRNINISLDLQQWCINISQDPIIKICSKDLEILVKFYKRHTGQDTEKMGKICNKDSEK